MNYLSLKIRVKKNEGFSSLPYKDQIRKKENPLFRKTPTKAFLQNLFENDFKNALKDYKKHFNKFSFSKNIKELIIEMIFQLGIQNVLTFKKTLGHFKNNNKFLASLEMIDSTWYKQTPLRVENLIKNLLKQ